jgi:hypothetical protein
MPWLAARGISSPVGHGNLGTLVGVAIVFAVYGMLGVGLGALVRDQVATVVGLLIYLFVIEPVLTRIGSLDGMTIYLPGVAANALTHVTQTDRHLLDPWQGGLLLAAYGLALAGAGVRSAIRRDLA